MKTNPKTTAALCLTIAILPAFPAFSALVPIVNPSFESPIVPTYNVGGPITGWTITGPSEAGVWNPSTYPPVVPLTAPDGVQVGYINNYSGLTTVSQILGTDEQSNTKYVLSIAVGGRADGYNPGTDYSISLYAGSTLLTSVTPVTPPTSTWQYLSATFTSGSVSSGNPLEIVISGAHSGPGAQLDFDNVSLTVVPEPTTMIAGALLLLPFGVTTLRSMRRNGKS